MIEKYCRNIYNIGVHPNCRFSRVNCVCPDKSSYEYLCYQCYLAQNDIQSEEYQMKLNAESGEILIDHEFQQIIFCTSLDWGDHQIINIIVENVLEEFKASKVFSEQSRQAFVELVALALTYAAVFNDREISYISMIDAFKPEQFMIHFWNLLFIVMQRIRNGKECKKVLQELTRCFECVNLIFERREKIGEEYRNYLDRICIGLESTEHYLALEQTFLRQENKLIDFKMTSNSFVDFLFCGIDSDGTIVEYGLLKEQFENMCMVLKSFLMNYQTQKEVMEPNLYENLIMMLNSFFQKEMDIHLIKGLEKLDLQSKNAWKANAGLVMKYLQTVGRRNFITACELFSA